MHTVLPLNEKAQRSLPIYPITLGLSNDQEDIYRPNGARFHHFLYVSEGKGFFNFNGERTVLTKGTAVFIRKDFPVDYGSVGKVFKTSWVTFDGIGVDGILDYFGAGNYAVLSDESVEATIADFYKLYEKNVSAEILSQKIYEFAVSFFASLNKSLAPTALIKAKNYMDNNYNKDVSVYDAARFAGVSESKLFKLFRESERMTPIEYLKTVRISKAKQMLIGKELKIFEIAEKCGFSSTAYFCKVFREKSGCTPAAYREKFD